jgi:CTP synthase (UTP-ammonia lyase)
MTTRPLRVTILGEYSPSSETHRYTESALAHSTAHLGLVTESAWISTDDISNTTVSSTDALWLTTGGPHKDLNRAIDAIRIAREQGIPCLGTCGGFQHMVIEYTRNVLAIADAQHAEYDPSGSRLIISPLACSLKGQTMQLSFAPGSRVAQLYGRLTAKERYYCSFGINPEYGYLFENSAFRPVGADAEGETRVMEISEHLFFIGTLFVPQAESVAERPHPLVTGFLAAAAQRTLSIKR